MTTNTTPADVTFVVPCGGSKADQATTAADLYTGSFFRQVLAAAMAEAEATRRDMGVTVQVLILSALHGLVSLDQVVAPYDLKMGQAGSVTVETLAAQAVVRGLAGTEVFAFLPRAYRDRLAQAMATVDGAVTDVYEATEAGMGYMKGTAASIARTAEVVL